MPLYEHFCPDCQKTFEVLHLSQKDKDHKEKCKCGRMVKRVMALGSFRLKGDWFATTGKY